MEWLQYGYSGGTMSKEEQRSKGAGSIYQQADGLFAASVTLPDGPDGKRRRKVVRSKSKNVVVAKLRELRKELDKYGDITTSSLTVKEWLDQWVREYAEPNLRPKTVDGHKTVITKFIVPAIGKVKLDKLTAEHVKRVHRRVLETPKDPKLRGTNFPEGTVMLSTTYALLAHNVLSGALKAALQEGKIHRNPCDAVPRPRKRHTEEKALDVSQAIHLLAHASTRADGAMWAAFILTGGRRGEILGLERERIADVLDLSWQLQRLQSVKNVPADFEYRELGNGLYLTRPKSSAGHRIIPLVEPLRSILSLHAAHTTSGLVFTDGGRPWDPDKATKEWKALLVEAGLPSDIKLHGARHTTVDLLYEAGVPEAVISEIVGHSTRSVTRSYKSKGNTKQLTDAMQKMSELLVSK